MAWLFGHALITIAMQMNTALAQSNSLEPQCLKELTQACDGGYALGCIALGLMYLNGEGGAAGQGKSTRVFW